MKNFALRAGLMLACGLSLVIGIFAQTPVRLPLEDFFAEPLMRGAQLSPDGKHLAFLTTLGTGKVGVALMDLATGKLDPLVAARDENIKAFFWKGSEYIVYGGDLKGSGGGAWRSIPINPPKPGEKRRVVALSEAYDSRTSKSANFMNIVDELPYDPYHLMAWGRTSAGSYVTDMFLIDVRTGAHSVPANYRPVTGETVVGGDILDNNGVFRARGRFENKKYIIEVAPTPNSSYEKVAEFPALKGGWGLGFFAADNENLYVYNSEGTDTPVLHTFNVRTRKLSAPIFQPAKGSISGLIMSYDRSVLYGVTYTADKTYHHYFDAAREKLQKSIDSALPDTHNSIADTSSDEKIILVRASSDREPGTYYILDRTHGRMGPVGRTMSDINPAQMRPMEPISYLARDGLTIHGYLTRPAVTKGARVPLIILPHGGPYGVRDYWGFDPEVQFLANRGYAVLQPNYRGSSGYGDAFEKAGYHEWGGKMQDDLSDAVKWAIDQGIADPARVAIYGASYGGYATLAGLVFTPELYCCGANYVGPSDLKILVGRWNNIGRAEERDLFYERMMGNDKEFVVNRSPVNFVDRIRVPLFNAYGENDPRVDIDHWKRLESKLKQFNKIYEIMVEDNEGHGFYNEKNRLVYYRKLEAFFDRYLAPVRSGSAAASPSTASAKSGN